jgi:tetratricopeptide (TPR) repeat protein
MTRRPRPSARRALAQACLVLALFGLRARAAESPVRHAASAAPKPESATAADTDHSAAKGQKIDVVNPPARGADRLPPVEAPKADTPSKLEAAAEIGSLLKLGAALTDRGDFASAEIAYRQIMDAKHVAEPELKTALLGLAHMHRRQGTLTKAAAIYERYLKDYPGDDRTPDALLELGRTLRSLGVHRLAIAKFYNVINSTLKLPGDGFERYQVLAKTAQFEIAETHFLAGEFAEANKFYTRLRLLDLAPTDRARAHFKAGYALRLQGDHEASIKTLRAFIEQWPDAEDVPEARYLLAVTLRELKRPQEAFAATLELLRAEKSRTASDPKRWAYWQRRTGNQLANDFFESGDTMNARAIYAGLLELSAEPAWTLPITYQLGLCYERLGLGDKARQSYQSILDATGSTPSPDVAELATMSKWRIEHLEWREKVGQQISGFFSPANARQLASDRDTAKPSAATAATP